MSKDSEKVRHSDTDPCQARSADEIQQWLVRQIAEQLQIVPQRVQPDQPILASGIDSMQVVSVVAGLEDWLGFRFSANPLDDDPTIRQLSQRVSEIAIAETQKSAKIP